MYKKKSRRSYGSGGISKNRKINRYTAIWYDEEGQKHTKSTFPLTPAGYKQAEEFLYVINSKKSKGIHIANNITLGSAIAEMIAIQSGSVRKATSRQMQLTEKRILKLAGGLLSTPLIEVSTGQLERLYAKMQANNYAVNTIRETHSLINHAFKRQIRNKTIEFNPAATAILPAPKRKKEIDVLDWRTIGKIFLYLRQGRKTQRNYRLMFRLLHNTGMRISELLALQWKDINLAKREIHIKATASGINGRYLESPKTKAGNRYIPILSNKTLKLLEQYKQPTGYVFQTKKGNRLPYSNIHKKWQSMQKALGFTQGIHAFRHTFASVMLSRGFPLIEVSRILGHSSPQVTLNVYSHAMPNANQSLIAMYNKLY